jgi:cytochrome c5
MFVIDNVNQARRGPFSDAAATHEFIYDPFYSSSDYCATCHDVSNPAFSKVGNEYLLNDLNTKAPSFNTYHLFPSERTYSEWKMSAYNTTPEGIASSVFGGNKTHVSSCQDCHMKDVTGKGCNKQNAPNRTNLPLHDFTGGNTFVPKLISEGNTAALEAGILRARNMLKNAATMDLTVTQEIAGYKTSVKITNETGHKLPSGYPEGRRMWLNITAYDINNNIIYESGAYNQSTAELNKKDTYNNDSKIYEAKLGLSSTGQESFHFAINNVVLKDNRIPPRGFTNSNFESIQAAPVGYTYADGDYFDITNYNVPHNTHRLNVKLLYQTTSKEYVEFLKNANTTNSTGTNLYNLWLANGKSTPEIMIEKDFYTSTLAVDVYSEVFTKPLNIYPNPVFDLAKLKFSLKNAESIAIEIYDYTGKKISTLFKGYVNSHENEIEWNTQSLRSGTYIVVFKTSKRTFSLLVRVK